MRSGRRGTHVVPAARLTVGGAKSEDSRYEDGRLDAANDHVAVGDQPAKARMMGIATNWVT